VSEIRVLRGKAPSVVLICVASISAKVRGLCGLPFAPSRLMLA